MARLARVVAVAVAHQITQRGTGRQFILTSATEDGGLHEGSMTPATLTRRC